MDDIPALIHSLSINGTYLGYRYLYHAVALAMENEDYLLSIGKWLYP